MNEQIAQVLGRIPNLTPEQTDALSKVDLVSLADASDKAESNHGFAATATMSIVHTSVEFEVFAVARLAVLGILSGDESLTKPWTDTVGAFEDHPLLSLDGETGVITHAETGIVVGQAPTIAENIASLVPAIDTPHAPTEAEVADLGAPETVVEAPAVETVAPAAEEVGTPALVDAPLDIQEGEINV